MKKSKQNQNVLEFVPVRKIENYSTDDSGVITLEIENKGFYNRVAQKLFKKPKITYIHLDEMGSFVWPIIDGEMDIMKIGEYVKEHFGEKAEPLYPRLAKYFEILKSYGFIEFK